MIKTIKNWFKKDNCGIPYYYAEMWNLANAVYSPAKYEIYAREGYMSNPIVYRCINLIATACAGIPWKLYRKDADGKDIHIEQAPVLDLLYMPNPTMGQADFFTYLFSYLQLSGNVYVKKAGPTRGVPRELYFLRPDRVTIKNGDCYNECGIIPIYEYECSGRRETIDPRDMWHGKLWNPLCDFFGLSPLAAASRSIAQLNEAMDWNVALLQNSANPSGVLSTEGNLNDEQIMRLKEQLAKKYQGKWNAGRPMVLEGGLEWNQMSLTPHEMEWNNSQKMSTKYICIAFGVDPVLLGDAENRTYATFKDAEKSFYTSTVLPNLDRIRDDFLNTWLLPKFPNTENMYFDYDRDSIEVLGEDRTIVWDRAIKGLKEGLITLNEAREAIGYSEMDVTGEDGIEDVLEEDLEEEVEDIEEEIAIEEEQKKKFIKAINITTPAEKREYHRHIEAMRKKWDGIVRVQVRKRFRKEKKAVLKAVRASTPDNVEQNALGAISPEAWKLLYESFYPKVMTDFGEQTIQSYKYFTDMEVKVDEQAAWIDEAFIQETTDQRVGEVLDTTNQRITALIVAALLADEGIEEIEEGINELYKEDIPIRSRAIAQTEVITAGNAGTRFAVISLGGPITKQWSAILDNRTRESHRNIDGELRGIDTEYSNGLMYPGDPSGSAEETINCRCVEVYNI